MLVTVPTQLALSFFGILHVPINIPALAVSLRQDVDLNREILSHGMSNILSGFCGACQVGNNIVLIAVELSCLFKLIAVH